MAVIDHLDIPARRIYLLAGVREYHPVDDLYRELRVLRRTDEGLRGFDPPVIGQGRVSKGGGKFTPRYVVFQDGWRVVPEDVSHTLAVTGEQLTAEGGSGAAALDLTLLSVTTRIAVEYAPSEAEVIEVVTGSAVTAQDKIDIAAAAWARVIEGSETAESALRLLLAFVAGNASNLVTGVAQHKSLDGSKVRLAATFSGDGNTRTITTRDGE